MQKEQENEESAMDSLLCPSFSVYSSNNVNHVAQQVINENDYSHSQNDIDDFQFVAFHKTADEVFFNHRRGNSTRGVFPIFNRDDEKGNSVVTKRSSDVGDDLDAVSPASYCLWIPLTASPVASPIKCKKSNSTGSASNPSSSRRWKFLSLLRRSKSDGKESLILVTPSLEFKKEAKVESSKVKSGGKGNAEFKNIAKVVETKIPVAERNIPAQVTAMEAFYLRKKEIKRKSYLPYKEELIGFGVGFHSTIGRGFPPHV